MIERFDTEKHLGQVNGWLAARGRNPLDLGLLPEVGFVVDDCAAGWVFRTDAAVALLDGFVSNPGAPFDARQRAMDGIADALIDEADRFGARLIVAYTEHDGIRARALARGFSDHGLRSELLRLKRAP